MIEFTNLTSKPIRRRIFEKFYRSIVPKNYDLSVVFAPPALMTKLNKIYRRKNKPANVLSFLLNDGSSDVRKVKPGRRYRSGEIFLNVAERDLSYLFIHGCLHILSFDHKTSKEAKKMEEQEQAIFTKIEK